jgi:uncharacterized protein HemY
LASDNAQVADTLGWVYYQAGKLDEAQQALQRSLELEAMTVNRYHLGMVLEKLKRSAEAKEQYRLGIEMAKGVTNDAYLDLMKKRYDAIGAK